jgi:hypothetical protein
MGIRAQGSPKAKYNAVWQQTGLGAVNQKPGPFEATGGTKSTSGDQTIHTFNYPNSATFVVTGSPKACKILVIAGGYAYATGHDMAPGTYTITVGAGGAGVNNPTGSQSGPRGNYGGDSVFSTPAAANTITSKGGGGGGAGYTPGQSTQMAGASGGSGGGAGSSPESSPTTNMGEGTQPAQNPSYSNGSLTQAGSDGGYESGGTGDGVGGGGGGGGGTGTPSPQSPTPTTGGGPGVSNSISGSSVTYCEGGYSWGGPTGTERTTKGSGGLGAPGASVTSGVGQPGVIIISYPT